jgi:hypothetical protein
VQVNRLFVEVVLWIARTSAAWRELTEESGHWARKGLWGAYFQNPIGRSQPRTSPFSMQRIPGSTSMEKRTRNQGSENLGGLPPRLQRSSMHAAQSDWLRALAGQRHEMTRFDALTADIACLAFIGDKAIVANRLGKYLAGRSTGAPIP